MVVLENRCCSAGGISIGSDLSAAAEFRCICVLMIAGSWKLLLADAGRLDTCTER